MDDFGGTFASDDRDAAAIETSESPVRMVPHSHFDSLAYNGSERADRWEAHLGGLYHILKSDKNPNAPVPMARSTSWHLGGLVLVDGHYAGQSLSRTPNAIRRDQVDHFKIIVRKADTTAGGRIGGVFVYDMAQPKAFDASATSYEQTSLYIARETLDELLPAPPRFHELKLHNVAAHMFADHLASLVRHMSRTTLDEAPTVATMTRTLLAACLAPCAQTMNQAKPALEATLMRQISRYVELHLAEDSLGAPTLCATFKLSRATLYRLFEPMGGVASFIRERRLQRVHEKLAGAAGRVHLGRVAEEFGFKTQSQFSDAFRQRFRYAPRDAIGRLRTDVDVPLPRAFGGSNFGDWVRRISG